ncbi:MAG: isochorismate synthase, partial [Flavobacteriaceae bacterium]|nr:isochorismate synthase [Flavobacteriaceae bacterium]
PGIEKVCALFQQDSNLYLLKDYSEKGFLFNPFDITKHGVLLPLDKSKFLSCAWTSFKTEANNTPLNAVNSPEYRDNYIKLVSKALECIKTSDTKKIVTSRSETLNYTYNSIIPIIKSLFSLYPLAFCYCWYHPELGLWLGASPESLVSIKNESFYTMALAGTQKVNDQNAALSWQAKDKEEQDMVSQCIIEQLTPLVPYLNISEAYSQIAGSLAHIKTDISGKINSEISIKDLIKRLHPTPAVCGLPREQARTFLEYHEGYDREFYAGNMGELNFDDGNSDIYVNLRCMKLLNNKAILYVGGGIIEASVPEKEWEETVYKTETMKKVLFNAL